MPRGCKLVVTNVCLVPAVAVFSDVRVAFRTGRGRTRGQRSACGLKNSNEEGGAWAAMTRMPARARNRDTVTKQRQCALPGAARSARALRDLRIVRSPLLCVPMCPSWLIQAQKHVSGTLRFWPKPLKSAT